MLFNTIREFGRWQCDRTLRRYLDVISVMGNDEALRLAPFVPLLQAVVGADGARGTQLSAMSDKEHDLPLPSAEILWKSSG